MNENFSDTKLLVSTQLPFVEAVETRELYQLIHFFLRSAFDFFFLLENLI